MFDIKNISQRYFEVKLSINDDEGNEIKGITVEVEPPKLKVLKKITAISKSNNEDAIENLTESMRMILNKNKAKTKVSEEYIEDLDLDQMNNLLMEYFKWLGEAKDSKN